VCSVLSDGRRAPPASRSGWGQRCEQSSTRIRAKQRSHVALVNGDQDVERSRPQGGACRE
jgi:hypothetical protein